MFEPGPSLLAVLLVGDEFEISEAQGATRVLTSIGGQVDVFPFPHWFDRARPPALSWAQLEDSLFRLGFPSMSVWSAHLVKLGEQFRLRLHGSTKANFASAFSALAEDGLICKLSQPHFRKLKNALSQGAPLAADELDGLEIQWFVNGELQVAQSQTGDGLMGNLRSKASKFFRRGQ